MRSNCRSLRRAGKAGKTSKVRAVTASRFHETRLTCGLSIAAAAKLFRVTERTLQNWEAGKVRVPYAAYKLMRILRGHEFPDPAWKGYRVVGDTLWSPEGHSFKPSQMTWWSLTCRMAAEFRTIMVKAKVLESQLLRELGSPLTQVYPHQGTRQIASHVAGGQAPDGRVSEAGIPAGFEAQRLDSTEDSTESPILTLPPRPATGLTRDSLLQERGTSSIAGKISSKVPQSSSVSGALAIGGAL